MINSRKAMELSDEGLASIDEACKFLDVGMTKLYELNRDRVIPYVRVGRIRKIPWRALKEYIAGLLQEIN